MYCKTFVLAVCTVKRMLCFGCLPLIIGVHTSFAIYNILRWLDPLARSNVLSYAGIVEFGGNRVRTEMLVD